MGKWSTAGFILSQWSPVPPVLTADLTGKSVLVVGANTGLGLETAIHFARMKPARLIVTCRNEQKGRDTVSHIAKVTSYRAEAQVTDLGDFESVKSFAKRLNGDPLDIIIANAGVAQTEFKSTKDGWEETVQVNHLSTALLSILLVPNLLWASELHGTSSRLVIVSSGVHSWVPSNDAWLSQNSMLGTLSDKEYCTREVMARRYPVSKLLNVLFTRAFAQHLNKPSAIIPTSVTPPLCTTDLARNMPLSEKIPLIIMRAFLSQSVEKGARPLIWAALGPDGKDGPHVRHTMHGAFVAFGHVEEPSDFVISKAGYEAQEKLWQETIDVLSNVDPAVRSIVEKHLSQ